MDTERFLFVSADTALITDLAWQVHREGHVKYYIEAESDREIGEGFVPKTDDWRAEVEWADVIIFDDIWVGSDIGTGALAEELREQGKAVVGGTPNTDHLEEDRGYAMEILEDHGVNTVEHHIFHDFDAGIRHVQENPAPYVIKPLGEVQNVKRLLYVGNEDDGSDVVDVLNAYKKAWGHRMKGFQLQRKVEGVVEVAICGFSTATSSLTQVNFNFEHKKLFPGNIGPSTGEMGTSMFWAGQNKLLFKETFGKLEGWLANEGYVGSIDLNCIVNETGIYPLEFTPRFGTRRSPYRRSRSSRRPAHSSPISRAVTVTNLKSTFTTATRSRFGSSSRRSRSTTRRRTTRTPERGRGLRDGEPGRHPPRRREAGRRPVARRRQQQRMPIVVTGKGDTMQAAREQAYDRIDDIVMPNMYYRDDIGERWIDGDGDRLQAWGYLGP